MPYLILFVVLAASTQIYFIQDINQLILDSFDFLPNLLWVTYPFNFYCSLIWLVLVCYFLYRKSPKTALVFVAVFFAGLCIEIVLKLFLPTPHLFTEKFFGMDLAGSFPSGHVLRATLIAGGLRLLGAGLWIWILPVVQGVAMLSVAGHWPTDLFGGWLLGMCGISVVLLFVDKK